MTRVMVTGGAGFIGSHLVDALLDRGCEVVVLDNLSTGYRHNMASFIDRVQFCDADITKLEMIMPAFEGVDTVFHLAALSSVPRSVEDPKASFESIAGGTLHVLQAAVKHRVSKVILAASSAAYGNAIEDMKHEGLGTEALSPYGAAKISAEKLMESFATVYDIETVCLRYFNIFGPRQDPHSDYAAVIPRFAKAMLADEAPVITGDGDQSRDFTYVENAVNANLCAMDKKDVLPGRVYNVACGQRIFVPEIVKAINHILGTTIEAQYADPRPGDVRHSLASIERAQTELNYQVKVEFQEGIRRTVEWLKSHHD